MSSTCLTGGCGCGAVRFKLSAPPLAAAYCHCTRCQKRTGTGAAASARIDPDSLTIVAGEDQLRDWTLDTGLAKSFCGRCGSHVFARDRETGKVAVIRMAAFDTDPGARPGARQFVAYAAVWEPIPDDGLPRYPEAIPR